MPEESACLGFPAVSVRTSTERPEAMDKGVFIIGSIAAEHVIQAVDMAVRIKPCRFNVPAYSDKNVSDTVVKNNSILYAYYKHYGVEKIILCES